MLRRGYWMIACVFFVFLHTQSLAQQFTNPILALRGKPDLVVGLDNRRTHLEGEPTLLFGAYVGLRFEDRIRLKLGVCGLPFVSGDFTFLDGSVRKHQLLFVNIGAEYDFWVSGRFRWISNFQVGYGYNYVQQMQLSKQLVPLSRDVIVPVEAGLYAGYDILPFLRIKFGGGWRWVSPSKVYDLSGYYVKIGCNIRSKQALQYYRDHKERL